MAPLTGSYSCRSHGVDPGTLTSTSSSPRDKIAAPRLGMQRWLGAKPQKSGGSTPRVAKLSAPGPPPPSRGDSDPQGGGLGPSQCPLMELKISFRCRPSGLLLLAAIGEWVFPRLASTGLGMGGLIAEMARGRRAW